MTDLENSPLPITPQLLLRAYAAGVFPMADSADDDELFWVDPEFRGILPLDQFHIPKSLKKSYRKSNYNVTVNTSFNDVLEGCAGGGGGRDSTWINDPIKRLYRILFQMGHCHSVETWENGRLVGGLYGVSLGGAFFGESMFSTATNASKIALIELVYRMRVGGFTLLDTQFTTEHLEQFGVIEISRDAYQDLLADALTISANLQTYDGGETSESILQSLSQTS